MTRTIRELDYEAGFRAGYANEHPFTANVSVREEKTASYARGLLFGRMKAKSEQGIAQMMRENTGVL